LNIVKLSDSLSKTSFYFNICPINQDDEIDQFFKIKLKTTVIRSLKGRKRIVILLVDDEYIIRNSMKRLFSGTLKEFDVEIVFIEANDGVESVLAVYLANINQVKIDFVVTDENMNFMNGSYASKIIKNLIQIKKLHDFPIFMSSAIGNNYIEGTEDIKKVFSKPMDKNKIKEILLTCQHLK